MNILKLSSKKDKADDNMYASVYIPQNINRYLVLYTLAMGITKSTLLRDLIEAWVITQKSRQNERDLIRTVIHKVQMHWKIECKINHNVVLDDYLEILKSELHTKGVYPEHIDLIVKGVRDAAY